MEILGCVNCPVNLLLGCVAVILAYIYITWNNNFFKKQGIRGPKPYPLIGNTLGQHLMKDFEKWKNEYGNIFGCFLGREPVFVISDLAILKEVFVKSFNNFRNRRRFRMLSSPFSLGVFFLEDAAWKRVRNIITPTFSSGKLRGMCTAINDCSRSLVANFKKTFTQAESVDMKQYFGAFTMDVIASTAFGVKVDSQNNFEDPFVINAKKMFQPRASRQLLMILVGLFPSVAGLFRTARLTFFPTDFMSFFVTNITDMIKQRRSEPMEVRKNRTDFLQLLIDAEIQEGPEEVQSSNKVTDETPDKQTIKRLTTDEIIGQGILFFIAGYETTASTLNFASYLLATHPDIQEKAYEEIMDVMGKDEPDYDNIMKLKYLENVILETLRLYPPVTMLNRRATETISLNGVTVPAEASVFIPIFSLQRDPQLFHDPEKFIPERHNEKYNPLSFLSFGYGPRICIGMRLALIEMKIALVHILRQMKFEVTDDTPIPLNVKGINTIQPTVPIKLRLTPR